MTRRAAIAGASLAATLALAAPAGAATSVQIEDDGTLHVLGDAGNNKMVGGLPVLTRIAGSESLTDTLSISTLGGRDGVTVDPDAETLITPVIDLGAGQ